MPRRTEPDALALKVGQRVRELRIEAGLTIEELAYQSEFRSKGHLSNLERGLVIPTVASLQKLADHLGVLVADLVVFPDDESSCLTRELRERAELIQLTRFLTRGSVRKMLRELRPLARAAESADEKKRAKTQRVSPRKKKTSS